MMIVIFCIYQFFNIIVSKNILLPFKQLLLKNCEKEYNITYFLDDNLHFNAYSLINIGEPKQQMIILFNQNNNEILIHKNHPYCKYISKKFNYLPEISKTSKFLNNSNISNNITQYLINEEIELYTDKNCLDKIKSKLDFYYLQENDNNLNNYCADFGFPINKYLNKINSMTFIQQLKDQKIIDNYLITIEFNASYSGFFHIGNFPHEFDKNNFKEYQLISTYSIPKNFLFQFQLSIDKIYISYINNSTPNEIQFGDNKIYFNLELGIILGPKEYFLKINKIFFKKYTEKKICKEEVYHKILYDPLYSTIMPKTYYAISCDKNKIVDDIFFDISTFPSLNFYHREMNYTFHLTYKELFIEINDIYYFLIVDILTNNDYWQLGVPFLRKYQTTFNIDTRKIYFYNKEINLINNVEKGNNNNFVLLVFGCFVLSIFLISIAFIIGKKINEHRKIRKNELEDDNYNYISSLSINSPYNFINKTIELNIKNKK